MACPSASLSSKCCGSRADSPGLTRYAAARSFLHDAHVGLSVTKAQAKRIHARDVLLVAADGSARGSFYPRSDVQDDQCRDATPVVFRLSALGLRPARCDL